MIRQKLLFQSVFSFSVFVLFNACQKQETTSTTFTGASNEALSIMTNKAISDDVDAATLRQGQNTCNWQDLLPECATITVSSEDFPKEIIIDYGEGCVDNYGRTKSGKIIINVSDEMINEGAERIVTFENFMVNDVSVEGSRSALNVGENEQGYPSFTRELAMTFMKNGYTFSRSFSGATIWISGYDTPECGDNVIELDGAGTCVRPNGVTIQRTIIEPLLIDHVCGYIIAGIVEIATPVGVRTLDFGDGACDSIAWLTFNGETWEIDLDNFQSNGPQ
jgi:hypothetical protein